MDSKTLTFYVRESLVVVGTDPEMADYDNPRGELVGESHRVVAEDEDGSRYEHRYAAVTRNGYTLSDLSVDRLEALAAYLNKAHPVLDEDLWHEIDPAYGSMAYQREGTEAERAYMERYHDLDA